MTDEKQSPAVATQSVALEDTYAVREAGMTREDIRAALAETAPPQRRCLTGEEILNAEDRSFADNWVPTPEWGGEGAGVYVLIPTCEDREQYEKMTKSRTEQRGRRKVKVKEMNFDQLRERLTVDFACNAEGQLLFPCKNQEQRRETIRRLKKKAAAPIGRIGDLVCDLMGWSANDIEDMVGNSESDPSS